ncbi:protein GVQW3 [Nephila pilipes]|uniref:Protein GVQW3 n=1 Tax=Nephila pilipes TaxID=299642 RepID=A0A8X6J2R9_NEPPI|nr:protein GVQW3 [Nephila pilipes]
MTERIEQRYGIKFCQKLGDSQSQTIRKIQQVFGEDATSVTQIKEWFNRFKDGRTSAESEQRYGKPQTARSAANVERVRNLVMTDRRLTVREIAEEVGVSKDSAHAILREDLNMNRVAAKFVPKLLSPEQKDLRFDVAQDLLDTANTDPGFLNTVITTGDESWVYGFIIFGKAKLQRKIILKEIELCGLRWRKSSAQIHTGRSLPATASRVCSEDRQSLTSLMT